MINALRKAGFASCILVGAVVLLALPGCRDALARRVVMPLNLHDPMRGTDTPPEILKSQFVSQQLRIPVGPPDASIAVWVCEPFYGHECLTYTGRAQQMRAIFKRTPASRPAPEPAVKGTIFILHGIKDSKEMAPYVFYREAFAQAGYRIIQVDLRGHGRSTGDSITFGVVESQDMKQVLDELQKRGLVTGDVGVFGISYGAAVAIQWAAKDPRIRAIVALEPFCTMEDACIDAAPIVLGPARWLFSTNYLRSSVQRAAELANFNSADASPLAAVATLDRPVLIFHSKTDEFVNVRQSQRLHDANPKWVKLVLVENQSHFWLWLKSFDLIQNMSCEWMNRYVAHDLPTTQRGL